MLKMAELKVKHIILQSFKFEIHGKPLHLDDIENNAFGSMNVKLHFFLIYPEQINACITKI